MLAASASRRPGSTSDASFPLCRVTEKGNYSEKEAANLIRQILDGVTYLHAQGAVCLHEGLHDRHSITGTGGEPVLHPIPLLLCPILLQQSCDIAAILQALCTETSSLRT